MKTQENEGDVEAFLGAVENKRRREDARVVLDMMARITGKPARMWGASIIGFGKYHYSRKDGSKHSFAVTCLSPRKAALTVYIMTGFKDFEDQLSRLGKYKNSVSCLYITRLENIDLDVLEEMITASVEKMKELYVCE